MERKIAKLLACTGVIMGGAIALLPLTSYAIEPTPGDILKEHGYVCDKANPSTLTNSDGWGVTDLTTKGCASSSGAQRVAVNIESQISLDAASGTVIRTSPHNLGTGEISATVTSTHNYTISLSATETSLVKSDDSTLGIPAASGFTKDDDAWGIKKQNATNYSAITTSPEVYYTGTPSPSAQETKFEVGVAVTEQTAPGTYQTDITVTATATD